MKAGVTVRLGETLEPGGIEGRLAPHASHSIKSGACTRCGVRITWAKIEEECGRPRPTPAEQERNRVRNRARRAKQRAERSASSSNWST